MSCKKVTFICILLLTLVSAKLVNAYNIQDQCSSDKVSQKELCLDAVNIDKSLQSYEKFEQISHENSSEGELTSVYYNEDKIVKIETSSFGDIGNSDEHIYILGKEHYLYSIIERFYDKPFYMEDYKIIKTDSVIIFYNNDKREILLNNSQSAIDEKFINKKKDRINILVLKYSTSYKEKYLHKDYLTIVNNTVTSIDDAIRRDELKVISTTFIKSNFKFYYNEMSLKKCVLEVTHPRYSHIFQYYFDNNGKILKYLKVSSVTKELEGELDTTRRAIIYDNNSNPVWANNLFDPPVSDTDIYNMFQNMKHISSDVEGF